MHVPFCPACLTHAEERGDVCRNCGAPRPESGWPRTSESRYPWLGETLGQRYRLRQYIGYGATGEVYRAEALSTSRSFAVKVIDRSALPRQLDFDELRARLFREVAILGAIRSPYIVSLVDFVELPDDVFVLVMELASGVTLERMVFDQHRLPLIRALEITEQLLEALSDIHEQGVVHRDLKPENIVVRSLRSGRPFIQLLDFGVAKLRGEPNVTHGFVGTPLFASPEQIRNAEITDQRTDLYACGCILFNLLAGYPPFRAERGAEVMRMHLTMPPPPLPLRTGSAELDSLLDAFLSRALEKDPDKRFGTATEMLASSLFDMGRNYALLRAPADEFVPEPPTKVQPEKVVLPEIQDPRATFVAQPHVTAAVGTARAHGIAISSSGDMGACVLSSGELVLRDLEKDVEVASHPFKRGALAPDLHFLEERQALAVVHATGLVEILETKDLSCRASHRAPAKRILWSARAATRPDVLLLVERERLISLDVESGASTVARFPEPLEQAPLAAQQPWGWVFHVPGMLGEYGAQESVRGCTIRKTETRARVEENDVLHDVREDGALLVERDGVFLEIDRETGARRVVLREPQVAWAFASWLTAESLLGVSEQGTLYLLAMGAAPQVLARNLQRFRMSEDRSAAYYMAAEDIVEVWRAPVIERAPVPNAPAPGTPSLSKPTAREKALWHFEPGAVTMAVAHERVLLTSQGKGWVHVHGPAEGEPVALHVLSDGAGLVWTDAEGNLTSALADGRIRTWRGETLEGVVRMACSNALDFVCMATEGKEVVAFRRKRRGPDRMVRMWGRTFGAEISALCLAPQAGVMVVAGGDGTLHLLDLSSGAIRAKVPVSAGRIDALAISPDGHMVVALREGENVELYDTHAVRVAYRTRLARGGASQVALRADGEILAGFIEGGALEIRRASSDELVVREALPGAATVGAKGTGS